MCKFLDRSFGAPVGDPYAPRANPQVLIFFPIVDQKIAWFGVLILLPGSAASNLDAWPKVFPRPGPFIVRSLRDGAGDTRQYYGPVLAQDGPQSD